MSINSHRQKCPLQRGNATDSELLAQYLKQNDSNAFAELVRRYSDMVFRLCRRMLHDEHAAEDAFQATFIVLARRAARIHSRQSLAGWLYCVAYRTARRAQKARRGRREQILFDDMKCTEKDILAAIAQRQEHQLLDEELQKLAAKYREPLVLRYLMGKSNQDIAAELGVTIGVVEGRLKRGKDQLRQRLVRRGISATFALATVSTTSMSAKAAEPLIAAAVEAASAIGAGTQLPGGISQYAVYLSRQELTMNVSKLALAVSMVAVAFAVVGVGLFQSSVMGQQPNRSISRTVIASAVNAPDASDAVSFTAIEESEPSPELTGQDLNDQAEKDILAALSKRTNLNFIEAPLRQVVSRIGDMHSINVILDHQALGDVGVAPESPVTVDLTGVPLESVLTHVLQPLDLAWTIHEGVLLITSADEAEQMLVTKVYDVSELIRFVDENGEEWSDFDTLIALITRTVASETWDEVGGRGAIEPAPLAGADMLAIAQNYHVHQKISTLLTAMREIGSKRGGTGLPVRERPSSFAGGMHFGGGNESLFGGTSTGTGPERTVTPDDAAGAPRDD